MYALARVSAAQREFFAALNAYHGVMIDLHAVFNLLLDMPYVLRSRGFVRISAHIPLSSPASALASPLRL